MSLELYGYRRVFHAVDIDFTVIQLAAEQGPLPPAITRMFADLERRGELDHAIARMNQPLRKLRPGELRYPS